MGHEGQRRFLERDTMKKLKADNEVDADVAFKELGATAFYDEYYPSRRSDYSFCTGVLISRRRFARYYFNADGLEVGYFIDGIGVSAMHETPRKWDLPHTLEPLPEKLIGEIL